MQLARVCGQVISTKKAEKLMGFKILVCQPIDMVTFEEKGAPFVSIDSVGAGDGELVMCVSGSSSRQTALTDARPVDNCIVAIIDSVDILGERCFDKADPSVKPAAAKEKQKATKEANAEKAAPKQTAKAAQTAKPEQEKPAAKPVAEEKPAAQEKKPAAKPKTDDKGDTAAKKPAAELKMTETKPKKQTTAKKNTAKPRPTAPSPEKEAEAKRIVEDIIKKLDEEEKAKKAADDKQKKADKPQENKE